MSTSTFDASSSIDPPADTGPAPAVATAFEPGGDTGPESLLDQLRARVEDRDETEPQEWVKEVPRVGIRLVCDPDIDAADYQRWQRSAQPRRKGRGRAMTSPLDMDLLGLSVRALTATCLRVEMKRGERWEPMRGPDGAVLDLESKALLSAFNVIDSGALLKRLFGRDAKVIDAGQELLAEAGYLGDDEDDENPT